METPACYIALDLALANVGYVVIDSTDMELYGSGTVRNNKVHKLEAYDIPYRTAKLFEFADAMLESYGEGMLGLIYESIFHGKDKRAAIAMGASLALIGYFRQHIGSGMIHHIPAATMKKHISCVKGDDPKQKAMEFCFNKTGQMLPEHEADAYCIWDSWRTLNLSTNPFS